MPGSNDKTTLTSVLGDLLSGDVPGPTTPAPPPRRVQVGVPDGDGIAFGDEGGTIRDTDATPIGQVKVHTNPATFEAEIRLVISPEHWDRIEVVCAGNALDVDVEPLGEDRYKIERMVNGYKPATFKESEEFTLPQFESTKDFMQWIETLPKDMLSALKQIYFDRWNFGTGDRKDNIYYELVDEELQGRT